MLFIEQLLNGVQYGAFLFLLASGLTVVFGIMGVINLTHGTLYMVGAYAGAMTVASTGSFAAGVAAAVLGAGAYGLLAEIVVIRWLYDRDHLYQVLATLGLILFTNELVTILVGRSPIFMEVPGFLQGSVTVFPGLAYPVMRLALIGVGLLVAGGLYFLVNHTRFGMLMRAGADDRDMVDALGVNMRLLFLSVFGLGAVLCGLAGVMAAPLLAVEIGMGERILITTFVVIVIGGVGSIRGAFVGAMLVGMVDSLGRAYLPQILVAMLPASTASTLAAGLVSASTYMLMALVLLVRPNGLFPARS
ncbi:MAG: branched-chain amino acid ABC transporter permease [Mesorhizobium amorphae]|nr:MAG: branched-chain amino acid ABC transporter permease [Mesorhizobium amorphae]